MSVPSRQGARGIYLDEGALTVRALRPDRTIVATKAFIKASDEMGPTFTEPVTDTVEMIYDQMTEKVPVVYLLSVGGDPTDALETLARKKKQSLQAVSLGEGQEEYAKDIVAGLDARRAYRKLCAEQGSRRRRHAAQVGLLRPPALADVGPRANVGVA